MLVLRRARQRALSNDRRRRDNGSLCELRFIVWGFNLPFLILLREIKELMRPEIGLRTEAQQPAALLWHKPNVRRRVVQVGGARACVCV